MSGWWTALVVIGAVFYGLCWIAVGVAFWFIFIGRKQ